MRLLLWTYKKKVGEDVGKVVQKPHAGEYSALRKFDLTKQKICFLLGIGDSELK